MAKLSSLHKTLIVQRLATFVSDKEIIEELRTFGVEVDYAQIAYYNPQTAGSRLGKEWVQLFDETRKRFIDDTSSIAISHRAYRLQELDRLYKKSKTSPRENVPLSKEIIVEAEKISGNSYTNRRELTGKDGKPLVPGNPLEDLDDAELATLAQGILESMHGETDE